jgi:hypothetical protein
MVGVFSKVWILKPFLTVNFIQKKGFYIRERGFPSPESVLPQKNFFSSENLLIFLCGQLRLNADEEG